MHGLCRLEKFLQERKDPDPSRGGTRGYPTWFRKQMLQLVALGVKMPKRLQRSVRRWKKRPTAYEMTGNKARRGMTGHHCFSTCYFEEGIHT